MRPPFFAPWRRARALLAAWALLAGLLGGCAMVDIRSMSAGDYIAMKRGDIFTAGEPSTATLEALQVIGLDEDGCSERARACIDALATTAGLDDERRLSALAEIWLQAAKVLAPGNAVPHSDAALDAYLEVARHAYAYLFFTAREPGQRAFEDRQTQVRDYYNYAVQQVMTGLFQREQAAAAHGARHAAGPLRAGKWSIDGDMSGVRLPGGPSMLQEMIPASSIHFGGLRSTYRRDGFGAELVAVMKQRMPGTAEAGSEDGVAGDLADDTFLDAGSGPVYSEMSSPAITVLLRFSGESLAEVLSTRQVRAEACDPYMQSTIALRGHRVPLAANFTVGYGLWLARSGFAAQSLRTLLGCGQGLGRPHVFLMQPYDPQRRIILMIHGLASSPEAWVNVANEVLGDEVLRQHYQVWQVYYPTNMPISLNHAAIRDAVAQTLRRLDPGGSAPASRNMVLIGHSMGGVLSRLMVSTARDELWAPLLESPRFGGERLERVRDRLDPLLRFAPQPNVGRAIFIAAPHRGTPFAGNRIARWIANMVKLPARVLKRLDDVVHALTDGEVDPGSGQARLIPNSINNLKDSDPFIRAAAELPISPDVRYHSIIARSKPEVGLQDSDDGVVPYRSAHLDGAASEKVITASHSVQETPQAILEIRRILHEDLDGARMVASRAASVGR